MIGLDANVVVRLLVQDDAAQLKRAHKAISRYCSEDSPAFVNAIVLVEVVWVLSSAYRYSRKQIASAIEALLQVRELNIQHPSEAWEALHQYEECKADFSDIFLAAINRETGCAVTLTFDKRAAQLETFELL